MKATARRLWTENVLGRGVGLSADYRGCPLDKGVQAIAARLAMGAREGRSLMPPSPTATRASG